jgi:uncharacterized protein YigE (DUF2233 family)
MKTRLLYIILLTVFLSAGCAQVSLFIRNHTPCDADGRTFDVLEVDLETYDIRLFWKGPDGQPFLTFKNVRSWLENQGKELAAATNGGIYEPGYIPTGLYIEAGRLGHPLNLKDGYGNFYLKPNGVFLITEPGAKIIESSQFGKMNETVDYATQSGPLLVHGGKIHPAFTIGSHNRRLRSGIGVSRNHLVYIVVSDCAVNFYDFAAFFRDQLDCPDALYLDGSISRLYAPKLNRMRDDEGKFAVIIAVLPKERTQQ